MPEDLSEHQATIDVLRQRLGPEIALYKYCEQRFAIELDALPTHERRILDEYLDWVDQGQDEPFSLVERLAR